MKRKTGFSLVEVLLALAIGGLILTAATSLLVTISQAWANRPATRDAFDAHVNGVANFLTAMLEEATLTDGLNSQKKAITLDRAPGFSESDDPLVRFYLREAPPLFSGQNQGVLPVGCMCFFRSMIGMGCDCCGTQIFKTWKKMKKVSGNRKMMMNFFVP